MSNVLLIALVLGSIIEGAVLFGMLTSHRVRRRRTDERLRETARMYAWVRSTLAERRAAYPLGTAPGPNRAGIMLAHDPEPPHPGSHASS